MHSITSLSELCVCLFVLNKMNKSETRGGSTNICRHIYKHVYSHTGNSPTA